MTSHLFIVEVMECYEKYALKIMECISFIFVFFCLTELEACNLKKGVFFNPDPYMKLTIIPSQAQPPEGHHYRDLRSSVCPSTTNPVWDNEVTGMCWLCFIFELNLSSSL